MKMLQLSFVLLSLVFVVGIGNADQAAYPDPLYRGRISGDSDAVPTSDLPGRLKTPRTSGNLGANSDQSPDSASSDTSTDLPGRLQTPRTRGHSGANSDQTSDSTSGETSTDLPGTYGDPALKIYFVDTTVKATWFQALRLCRSRGMRLATVESHDEQSDLDSVLTTSGVQKAWLSGNDIGLTNNYKWASTGQPLNFTFWNYGEPSHSVIGEETEHCIEATEPRWRWSDNLCSNQENFVCEHYSSA